MREVEIRRIVNNVTYKGWRFDVEDIGEPSGALSLRATFDARDAYTGIVEPQHGRWWVLMGCETEDDILRTVLLAILTAEEHESRETFAYCGRHIFHPHKRRLLEAAS
jgi:hypothetical protein